MKLLRELTESEADVVKQFLIKTPLTHQINLRFEPIDLTLQITGLTSSFENEFYEDMDTRRFLGPDGNAEDPLMMGQRVGNLELYVGRWRDAARLSASHVVLGSVHARLDPRFGQVELSHCLSDGSTVYLTKNLTRHGGDGAIVRLNSGSANAQERSGRRERLVEALGAQVVQHDGLEYLVVSTIPLKDARRRSKSLLAQVLTDFLTYAGQVECIRSTGASSTLTGGQVNGRYRHRLSPEDRALIEIAAMTEAKRWLEEQGYSVRDVSDRKVGYDLHAERGADHLWVEVKGTTMAEWAVELTANEYACAQSAAERYVLFVVVLDDVSNRRVQAVIPIADPVSNPACAIAPSRFTVSPSPP